MQKLYFLLLLMCILVGGVTISKQSIAGPLCTGSFVNPITDVCWDCLFPLTIGSAPIVPSRLPDTTNPASPICLCGAPIPRIGISFGYWEPFALVDVTRDPFCMVNLGGIKLDVGGLKDSIGGGSDHADKTEKGGFYWVHWYKYPLLWWLNILSNVACLEKGDMDIAYLAELDPTWRDDALTLVLNPEAVLFGNPVAQMACAADSLKTLNGTSLPIDSLFWCLGSQGSSYPLDGSISVQTSPIQAATLAAERMTYKLHRELVVWDSRGVDGPALCQQAPTPILPKSRYRYQMVNTVPKADTCYPFGTNTMLWEAGHMPPTSSGNSGFLIWRKRNCCFL